MAQDQSQQQTDDSASKQALCRLSKRKGSRKFQLTGYCIFARHGHSGKVTLDIQAEGEGNRDNQPASKEDESRFAEKERNEHQAGGEYKLGHDVSELKASTERLSTFDYDHRLRFTRKPSASRSQVTRYEQQKTDDGNSPRSERKLAADECRNIIFQDWPRSELC